jgi:hypothetical protein
MAPRKRSKRKKLLFVDTNIWLDFYRARQEAGLKLLEKTEAVAGHIIVSYQLESEFKKNRQAAILEGMQELKPPSQIARPGLLSDAKDAKVMNQSIKEAEKRVKSLKTKLARVIANPAIHDPVYKICQRIFHKDDAITLSREDTNRNGIRRRALRRFLHGCPPRKRTDTSFGDAFNWEWIIQCAIDQNADVVVVSRDADYGITFEDKSYINDHLKQEFSERVSRKARVTLFGRLSEALKQFEVELPKQVVAAEEEVATAAKDSSGTSPIDRAKAIENALAEIERHFSHRTKSLSKLNIE